jgi:hypothetical protein
MSVCPRCAFELIEDPRARRPRRMRAAGLVAGVLTAGACAALILPAGRASESTPMSRADAERLLALRYPKLRDARDAVIACPSRRIEPGGEARCWILARVGQQRAVTVRLSPQGNTVEIDD